MSIAAVPEYLGQDFRHASPGMRFGMYLSIWTDRKDLEREVKKRARQGSREGQEIKAFLEQNGMDATIAWLQKRGRNALPQLWQKNDFASKKAWSRVAELTDADQAVIEGILARYAHCAVTLDRDAVLTLPAHSTAPFTTGLGNEHPLENGFSFLWPYGVPYLPGSGVKGVLRQAARELAEGKWDDQGWSTKKTFNVEVDKKSKKTIRLSMIDLLFGLESRDGEKDHFRGVLTFWDVIPQIQGDKLMVEIMTPHQTHYYQNGEPPHDSGQPTPIQFLTVPPGSRFTFHVVCDTNRLRRIASDLLEETDGKPRWKRLMEAAFQHAFQWLGFGAKTAVGYGAMEDKSAELPGQTGQPAEPIAQPKEETWKEARIRYDPGSRTLYAFKDQQEARLQGETAKELVEALGLSKARNRKLRQGELVAHVKVVSQANRVEILRLWME